MLTWTRISTQTHTLSPPDIHTDIQTDTQTYIDTQTDRQTDRQTDTVNSRDSFTNVDMEDDFNSDTHAVIS